MFELSEERLAELSLKLRITDTQVLRDHGQGFISLEIGIGIGPESKYPRLSFYQFDHKFYINVTVPSHQRGYDSTREMTLEEMTLFVRVAKRASPDARMTKELIKKVTELLTTNRDELNAALDLIAK